MENGKWEIRVEDWTKINIENAKFILEEAKDNIKYQNDASDKITNRAFAILTVLIPITSALIVFIVNNKTKPDNEYAIISYLLFLVIILLMAVMFGLSKIVFPRMFMPIGREPKELCCKAFLGINFDKELAKLAIVLNEIEASQVKIDYNKKQIAGRTTLLKYMMLSIGIIFIIVVSILWFILI